MSYSSPSSKMFPPEKLYQERQKYIQNIITRNQYRNLSKTYRTGVKILKCVKSENLDVEAAVDRLQLPDIDDRAQVLVRLVLNHEQEIDFLVEKTAISAKYHNLDSHLIQILIAEILWGKQMLKIGSRESEIILYHEADLKETFTETSTIFLSTEESFTSKFPTYLRINTLSISLESSINAFTKEGWNLLSRPDSYLDYVRIISRLREQDFIRDYHVSELLVFPAGTSFYEHPGYKTGKFLMQDKGSCLSSFLLNPKPGSIVLDMCAAPGLKSNHLANLINNEGIIYASDRHPDRYNRLCSMMDFTNVKCVRPIYNDCTNIKIEDVNYILVDVSSTYSGIFHKKDGASVARQLQYFNHLSSNILRHALQSFPNAKRVVYTTCSKFIEEGEKVVEDALKEVKDSYTLLDIKEMLWSQWISVGYTDKYSFANKCLRIKPEFDMGPSCFIAVFERNFSKPLTVYVHRVDTFSEIIYDNEESDEDVTITFDSQNNQCFDDNRPTQLQSFNSTFISQPIHSQTSKSTFVSQPTHSQTFNSQLSSQSAHLQSLMSQLINQPIRSQPTNSQFIHHSTHSGPFTSRMSRTMNPMVPFQSSYYTP